jgi:hypothetical protein
MILCPQCGQIVVETVLGREADKVNHRYTKHDPVAGFVLSVIASVVIASLVTAAWKALP